MGLFGKKVGGHVIKSRANLSGVNLINAGLINANLTGANLTHETPAIFRSAWDC
jgi:uncharacterized protein YjbI with pentapeptide repeats